MKISKAFTRLRQLTVAARAAISPRSSESLHLFELLDAARRAQLPVIKLGNLLRRLSGTPTKDRVVMHLQPLGGGSGSTAEMLALAAVASAMRPRRILEFGTFDGASAWHMLANAAEDCIITTLDLPPNAKVAGSTDCGLHGAAGPRPFLPSDPRVRLVEVDSRKWEPDIANVDFCFIDAGHSYECVKNDTEKALKVMRPDGLVMWHDAVWRRDHYEVNRYLRELRASDHDVRLVSVGPFDYCGLAVRLPPHEPEIPQQEPR